uniref:Putative secreted protein n=1 Tax=Anopheles triannulatus TaxID=58253 RepID=A0A2M4B1T0_9DIPT
MRTPGHMTAVAHLSAGFVATSSVAGFALRKLGNCSHGADRSNLRNSWASSSGSHTTRFFSSSYRSSTYPLSGKSRRCGCPSNP